MKEITILEQCWNHRSSARLLFLYIHIQTHWRVTACAYSVHSSTACTMISMCNCAEKQRLHGQRKGLYPRRCSPWSDQLWFLVTSVGFWVMFYLHFEQHTHHSSLMVFSPWPHACSSEGKPPHIGVFWWRTTEEHCFLPVIRYLLALLAQVIRNCSSVLSPTPASFCSC